MTNTAVYATLDSLLQLRKHCRDLPLSAKSLHSGRQAGRQVSRLRGRGVDFDQVRLYQPGDDIRNIDWRVTARTSKAHTKVFNEERERPVFIICEQSNRLFFSSQNYFKSVVCAQASALIAWVALAHNDRVGGMVFDADACHEIRPKRSRGAILQLLAQLVNSNNALRPSDAAHSEPLNLALRHSREVVRPGSILYVLCDHSAIDRLNQSSLGALSAHNDLILLPVFDPWEAKMPSSSSLAFTQGARQITLNFSGAALQTAWAEQFLARELAWQKLAKHLRCGLQTLDTISAPIDQLRLLLSEHARRWH